MPSYFWRCTECEIGLRVNARIDDRDNYPEDHCMCADGTHWVRVYEAPMNLRESYLDGQSRGDSYEKLKEVNKLERQRAVTKPEERSGINREINKLKKL